MIRLFLYGQLSKDYGEYLDFEAKTPREAVTALAYQCPKYRKYLTENNWHIILGKQENEITSQELDIGLGSFKEVHLIPEVMGEGSTFISGAFLFGGGLFLGGGLGAPLMMIGGGMMIGGLLMAMNKAPKPNRLEEQDKRASFIFSGAVNTSTQGLPIPRGYGRLLIGSAVISAAVYAENIL